MRRPVPMGGPGSGHSAQCTARKTDIESRTSDAASAGGSLRDLNFRGEPWSAGQPGAFPLSGVCDLLDACDTAGSACPAQGLGSTSAFRRAATWCRAEH